MSRPFIANDLLLRRLRLDLQDQDGRTALMHAAARRSRTLTKRMLAMGADPHVPDEDGYSIGDVLVERPSSKHDVELALALLGEDPGHKPAADRVLATAVTKKNSLAVELL